MLSTRTEPAVKAYHNPRGQIRLAGCLRHREIGLVGLITRSVHCPARFSGYRPRASRDVCGRCGCCSPRNPTRYAPDLACGGEQLATTEFEVESEVLSAHGCRLWPMARYTVPQTFRGEVLLMAQRVGSANLPLHRGQVPNWLADRMT